ncbi:hypothetical protein B0H10DRAFT_1985963 [Mycena sp. CBHHK59/15]|nr:hypothetical protein B0H10DRAFT_1985963 [Mycena sp. CBHHK59/15]
MSKEQIVKEVQRLLEGNDRSHVFYYRDVTVDSSGATKKKGIFQSSAFSRVIAVHCHATAMDGMQGPFKFADDNPDTWPEGVITMSVHALKRGLNYFRTGELVIPSPPTGNFSKTNWADRIDYSEGVPKRIPSTSAITAIVKKLTAAQWVKIIAAARAASTAQRDDVPAAAVIDVDAEVALEDFDLIDDDSDDA